MSAPERQHNARSRAVWRARRRDISGRTATTRTRVTEGDITTLVCAFNELGGVSAPPLWLRLSARRRRYAGWPAADTRGADAAARLQSLTAQVVGSRDVWDVVLAALAPNVSPHELDRDQTARAWQSEALTLEAVSKVCGREACELRAAATATLLSRAFRWEEDGRPHPSRVSGWGYCGRCDVFSAVGPAGTERALQALPQYQRYRLSGEPPWWQSTESAGKLCVRCRWDMHSWQATSRHPRADDRQALERRFARASNALLRVQSIRRERTARRVTTQAAMVGRGHWSMPPERRAD